MTTTETAILAGGCFWGMQELIRQLPGVVSTRVGYSGGDVPNATYRHHGTHAEAIEVVFDPARLSYRQLLALFFQIHDPTTPNRQGNDVGPQYRSGVYTTLPGQAADARAVMAELESNKVFDAPLVTEVQPLAAYWPAEDYHQDYYLQHPGQGYCAFVVGPKVAKFRRQFAGLLKPEA